MFLKGALRTAPGGDGGTRSAVAFGVGVRTAGPPSRVESRHSPPPLPLAAAALCGQACAAHALIKRQNWPQARFAVEDEGTAVAGGGGMRSSNCGSIQRHGKGPVSGKRSG